MHASLHPESGAPPPEAQVSGVTRFGSAVTAGAIAALAASVPAALRIAPIAGAQLDAIGVWLALSAATLAPSIVAIFVLRGARRGLASFGGPRTGDAGGRETAGGPVLPARDPAARALGFAAWVLASLDALLVFGSALRATTHHHALAGATFALVGLAVLVGLGVLVARLVAIASAWPAAVGRLLLGAIVALLAALFCWFTVRVARAAPSPAIDLLVDLLAYAIAAGFASRPSFVRWPVAVLGPPLAALVFVLGIAPLRAPSVQPAVAARAPLLAEPVRLTAGLVHAR